MPHWSATPATQPAGRSVPRGNRPGPTTEYRHRGLIEALLEVDLETGRTHQIRVHLAAIGLPVVGDRTYGVPLADGRMFLHAWKISLAHPVTGEHLDFTAPLPPDLADRLENLGAPHRGSLPDG